MNIYIGEPCFYCGVRSDVGCRHREIAIYEETPEIIELKSKAQFPAHHGVEKAKYSNKAGNGKKYKLNKKSNKITKVGFNTKSKDERGFSWGHQGCENDGVIKEEKKKRGRPRKYIY